jgi:hypothetical protein
MKLTKVKTARKTAKFRATMARKREMRKVIDAGGTVGGAQVAGDRAAMDIPLDAIPERVERTIRKLSRAREQDRITAIELIRLALRLLEGK